MSTDLATAHEQVRERVLDVDRLVKATAGGRIKGANPGWRRIELRPVDLSTGPHLQVVAYSDQQAFTSNYRWGEAAAAAFDELIDRGFGHWHVACTDGDVSFRVTKSGRVLLTTATKSHVRQTAHDRVKRRFVDPEAPFLHALGITDRAGRVKKSRADKYHQVEQFVRLLDGAVSDALAGGRLRAEQLKVVDLGCGNAYLTFATYHHLTVGMGLAVHVVGVDVKNQARRHNLEVAERLGWSSQVTFVEGAIADAAVVPPVDITMALHACDTATDDALARGVQWRSDLVLAAPCCHHDIQRQLKAGQPPEPYGLVTRHGILRERWGDALTDGLRAHLMRRAGYRTDLVEFVDSQHTPRNLMLRAHRTGAPLTPEQESEYSELVRAWDLRPRLATLLGERISAADYP
ncbi:MAG: SAM-dependent methyltransferase [Actinomycetes bacterium]